jgi:hypothetical protein
MKERNKVIILIIFLLFGLIMLKSSSNFHLLTGLRHFYHALFVPKNLYVPIVTDNFKFNKKGFCKIYKLQPKYFDYYDLNITFLNRHISSKFKFTGKLLIEFMYKDKVVSTKMVDRISSADYDGNDMTKYKKITFLTFEIPIIKKYKEDIHLRITVIESDQELAKYNNEIKLNIAVSTIP